MTLAVPAMAVCAIFTSCEDNHSPELPATGSGNYVITATVDNVNTVLQAAAIGSGEISARNAGVEADGGTQWVYYKDRYLYNLQYNDGNAGGTTSFAMNASGQVEARPKSYNITRFTTYGIVGEHIITVSAVDTDTKDASGNQAKGLGFNYLDVEAENNRTAVIPGENFLGNGEFVTFSGFVEANDRIYTSVVSMGMSKYGVNYDGGSRVRYPELVSTYAGGQGSGSFDIGVIPVTQFPDSAWVAIYKDDTFTKPVIARTDKIGFAAGRMKSQYYQTIWSDDDGNIYVFSPGYGRNHTGDFKKTGTLPSGVMRINAGEEKFDGTYYCNIEDLSGGFALYKCWHITDDWFLLQMYTGGTDAQDAIGGIGGGTNAIAVFKGSTKEFRYVTEGLPAQDNITSFGNAPYAEDGCIYVPVVTNDGAQPAIYKIDPATAKATKGLVVTSDSISSVGRLVPVM